MSRKLQPKNKDIVNLSVESAKNVWVRGADGKFKLNDKFEYYGRVEKGMTAFVTHTNKRGNNYKFIEDSAKLPKKTKNEVVKHLLDGRHKVAYLVKKK